MLRALARRLVSMFARRRRTPARALLVAAALVPGAAAADGEQAPRSEPDPAGERDGADDDATRDDAAGDDAAGDDAAGDGATEDDGQRDEGAVKVVTKEGGSGSFKAAHDAYARGRGLYEVAKYSEAIEAFARAYQLLPAGSEHDGRRRIILRDLVHAHLKAFGIDRDPKHLRIAREQLDRYRAALGSALPEERAEAEALGREIDAHLMLADAKLGTVTAEAARQAAVVAAQKREATLRAELRAEVSDDLRKEFNSRLAPEGPSMLDIGDPLDRPELLIGVGGVLVGLGAVATAVMAFTAFEVLDARNRWETDFSYPDAGRDALRDYDTFYPLMIALAIQGPALLLTGGTLLGVGIKRKRIATFAVSPSYSGEGGGQRFGLSLRLRM